MLAIVIPYYKLKFFRETLNSVEKQTDQRFTLYIGNDASAENPLDIIGEILQETNYHYFRYEDNMGGKDLTEQWNRVIGEIHDEKWIMILGDDDVLDKNVVEQFYNNLEQISENEISLIKFSQCIIDECGLTKSEYTKYPTFYPSKLFLEEKFFRKTRNSLSEHIFSKEVYEHFKFKKFPDAWHSDDLAILEFSKNKNFLFINDAKVYVRVSTESISGNDNSTYDKQLATYLYCETLLKNYSKCLSLNFVNHLVKRYREIIWRNGFEMNINFTKIYLQKKDYLNAFYSLKTKKDLRNRIKYLKK